MAEAAFGHYPHVKKRRSRQDPEAAKNVPADVLRGRVAGTLGAYGDVVNQPIPMVRPLQMISQLLTKRDKQPDTEYFLENLPFKNEAPVSQAAGRVGSFAPMNPAPVARAATDAVKRAGSDFAHASFQGSPHMVDPFWYNPSNKKMASFEASGMHNKVAQDPEFTAKLGSTPEEVMHAESPMIMGRQRGEKLDLMQMTPPSDLSLTTLREMIAQRKLSPESVNFSAGESLFEGIPKDELLKAEKLQELEQYKKYKDGGSVKSVRKAMRQKLHGYLT